MKNPFPILILLVLVFVSAIGVVYNQHQSRKLFVELQALHLTRDDFNVDWERRLLELNTWGGLDRIETLAVTKLKMKLPTVNDIVIVKQ